MQLSKIKKLSREGANQRGIIYISTDSVELIHIARGLAWGEADNDEGPLPIPMAPLHN